MSENKVTSSVLAGFFIGLILIVFALITYFTGLYTESWNQWVGVLLLGGGIIFAVINNSKERDHKVTFGNLFAFGFKTVAIITLMMIAYTLLFNALFPDVKEKIIDLARENALKNPGQATDQQIEQGMEMFSKNYTLFLIIGILFWYLVGGLVASLLGAAIAKKDGAEAPFENA
ncbi:MAG: DUF4199 domain-containing protein [Chitinophagaceae bacterium]|nr:DUF4199 domain-containing protein [Chitinophagaceae bacterium]